MAEVHRLQSCRRCRHLFVAGPGQRFCPDCLAAVRRERARKHLWGAPTTLSPLAVFAVATLVAALLGFTLRPTLTGLGAWVGAIAALLYIGRTA